MPLANLSDPSVSPIKVMRSNAGYYIGTSYRGGEGYSMPNTRESQEYYPTKEAAQTALDTNTYTQRLHM